jgi:hypothetical protein
VAAAEPQRWKADGGRKDRGYHEKPAWVNPLGEKPPGSIKKTTRLTRKANKEGLIKKKIQSSLFSYLFEQLKVT